MQKNSRRNSKLTVWAKELTSVDADMEKHENQKNFIELLPPEITLRIFSQLDDIQSFYRAFMTCRRWNYIIENNDFLWKPHCLALEYVCQEVDNDQNCGYSWRDILRRNCQISKVKGEWLGGKYSNIRSACGLPEKSMCPMSKETWGEILEAELRR
ncbi:F-box only protein 48 isoform X2 [Octodon degus]|nr:F-box only protein 48 isoform X2 [Octodon degus]XP_023576659.1 F-box only protein 48 isoform X2 [Octodon degus]